MYTNKYIYILSHLFFMSILCEGGNLTFRRSWRQLSSKGSIYSHFHFNFCLEFTENSPYLPQITTVTEISFFFAFIISPSLKRTLSTLQNEDLYSCLPLKFSCRSSPRCVKILKFYIFWFMETVLDEKIFTTWFKK